MEHLFDLKIYKNIYSYDYSTQDVTFYNCVCEYNDKSKAVEDLLLEFFCESLGSIIVLKNLEDKRFCLFLEKSNLIEISNIRQIKNQGSKK